MTDRFSALPVRWLIATARGTRREQEHGSLRGTNPRSSAAPQVPRLHRLPACRVWQGLGLRAVQRDVPPARAPARSLGENTIWPSRIDLASARCGHAAE